MKIILLQDVKNVGKKAILSKRVTDMSEIISFPRN